VVDEAGGGLAAQDGHLERVEHELCAQVVAHRPADTATAPGVDDRRQEQISLPRRHVGDVGDPEAVRLRSPKAPAHEVLGRRGLSRLPRRLRALAAA